MKKLMENLSQWAEWKKENKSAYDALVDLCPIWYSVYVRGYSG